jgi:ABC-type Mn2+/Zn2+ transport system ATPase subunit
MEDDLVYALGYFSLLSLIFPFTIFKLIHDISTFFWPFTEGKVITSCFVKEKDKTKAFIIDYQYWVNGKKWVSNNVGGQLTAREKAKKYPKGKTIIVYYNPNKPQKALLERGITISQVTLSVLSGICLSVLVVHSIYYSDVSLLVLPFWGSLIIVLKYITEYIYENAGSNSDDKQKLNEYARVESVNLQLKVPNLKTAGENINRENSTLSYPDIFSVENLTVAYENSIALDNISFQIPLGSRLAIVGQKGSGKSTLLKGLAGLLPLQSCKINQAPPEDYQDSIAYIPNQSDVDKDFPVSVGDVIMMGLYKTINQPRLSYLSDYEIIKNATDLMDISNLKNHAFRKLSTIQQQSVFWSRAIVQQARVVLADEILDVKDEMAQKLTLDILDKFRQSKTSIIISTQDLDLAASQFDYILLLNRKIVAFGTPQETIKPEYLLQVFSNDFWHAKNHY